jgi:hypothetical protein
MSHLLQCAILLLNDPSRRYVVYTSILVDVRLQQERFDNTLHIGDGEVAGL